MKDITRFESINELITYYKENEVFDPLSDEVINWIQVHYLSRLSIGLEDKYYELKQLTQKGGRVKLMEDEKGDLFAKFFNHEMVLISAMSHEDFKAHEEELAKVAFEAKARLTAVVEKKRQDNAKLRANQKEWLVPSTDAENALVTDAINAVASRKKRLTKAEKLNEMLKGIDGFDDEVRKKMMSNLAAKATDKNLNLVTFVNKKVEEAKQESESSTETTAEPKKPFDPSKLFGKK